MHLVVGKTTVIAILSKLIRNKKILIIDFDLINNNLHTIYGVKTIPKEIERQLQEESFLSEFRLNEKNLRNLIVKVDKKIHIISSTNLIFDDKYIPREERIENILNELKEEYDFIFIDTSFDSRYEELNKTMISLSNKIICITEGNLINIQKTNSLLNKTIKQEDKVEVVYNKKNKFTVSKRVMELMFSKCKIIGTLHYDNRYNKIINKNINKLYIPEVIKREFRNIISKI